MITLNPAIPDAADELARSGAEAADLDGELAVLEAALFVSLEGLDARARALQERARVAGAADIADAAELVVSDVLSRGGQLIEARQLQTLMLERARADGRRRIESRCQNYLASTYSRLGLSAESHEASGECVRLLDPSAPERWHVEHYLILALFTTLDRSERADFELFEESLRRARAFGEPTLLIAVLNNFAWTAMGAEATRERAGELADELERLVEQRPDLASVPIIDTLAVIHLQHNELEKAEALLTAALHSDETVEPDSFAELSVHLATVRRRQGRLGEASELLQRARASALKHKVSALAVDALRELAEIDAESGDFPRAYRRLRRYIEEHETARREESERRATVLQSFHGVELERDQRMLYQELALRDPLTKLYNRRYLDGELPKLVANGIVSVAMIDVDHFKWINDLHSHDVGDEVLRQLADLLRRHVRSVVASGFVVRLGGEEFLSIAPGIDAQDATIAFEQLRTAVQTHTWRAVPATLSPTVSLGVVTSCDRSGSSTLILSRADELLYQAKHAGRNRMLQDVFPAPR